MEITLDVGLFDDLGVKAKVRVADPATDRLHDTTRWGVATLVAACFFCHQGFRASVRMHRLDPSEPLAGVDPVFDVSVVVCGFLRGRLDSDGGVPTEAPQLHPALVLRVTDPFLLETLTNGNHDQPEDRTEHADRPGENDSEELEVFILQVRFEFLDDTHTTPCRCTLGFRSSPN